MAKVSILMNCFNGEKYLRESINSVLNQTFDDWEIIFWDNQSTTEVQKLLRPIMITGSNIFMRLHIRRYTQEEMLLLNVTGEYLAF